MPGSLRVLAIADDLTGAAEIAGIGHRAGRTSAIVLAGGSLDLLAGTSTDVAVVDIDSRLRTRDEAATLATTAAGAIRNVLGAHRPLLYKKTDSLLRGHPRAETEALAAAFGRRRILLVPCNPTAGRTIRDGVYRVFDTPLAETEFRHDPHHPAHTSDVRRLLGPGSMPVHVVRPGDTLAASGLVVGEASLPDDVAHWATQLDNDTLPAGGGEFFAAIFARQPHAAPPRTAEKARTRAPFLDERRRTLIVSGSTARSARQFCTWARTHRIPFHALPDHGIATGHPEPAWIESIAASLARHHVACLAVGEPVTDDANAHVRIGTVFAETARQLRAAGAFDHLVLEGGATSAEVLAALSIGALIVQREWAQGVVTHEAQPGAPLAVTMKPGSYPWPDSLRSHFLAILSDRPSQTTL